MTDSSFEPEKAPVGKPGNILPIYGLFSLNHNLIFVVNTHPFESIGITVMRFLKEIVKYFSLHTRSRDSLIKSSMELVHIEALPEETETSSQN